MVDGFIKDYKTSVAFAGLNEGESVDSVSDLFDAPLASDAQNASSSPPSLSPASPSSSSQTDRAALIVRPSEPPKSNVLATFKVPFALSEAEITFTGEKIEPEDFDALTDYVAIFKKQYVRKLERQAQATLPPSPNLREVQVDEDGMPIL